MTSFSYRTTVKKIGERHRDMRARKVGDQVEVERELIGYGLVLEGSHECLVFDEVPPFAVGDQVEVTIRKVVKP